MIAILLGLAAALCGAVSNPGDVVQQEEHEFAIGSARVSIVVHRSLEEGLRYVVLHEDEETAARAARAVVAACGGTLLEVRHGGGRNVSFRHAGQRYEFDPNRIFTAAGAAATLERLSGKPAPEEVLEEVRLFADSLLTLLLDGYSGALVAVHNNTEDNYSTASYLADGEYAAEAQEVAVVASEDADDFFFTTSTHIFDSVEQAGYNAVLQHLDAPTDDGSLSVYAASVRIPYVNVETQHGHYDQQMRMLRYLANQHDLWRDISRP